MEDVALKSAEAPMCFEVVATKRTSSKAASEIASDGQCVLLLS